MVLSLLESWLQLRFHLQRIVGGQVVHFNTRGAHKAPLVFLSLGVCRLCSCKSEKTWNHPCLHGAHSWLRTWNHYSRSISPSVCYFKCCVEMCMAVILSSLPGNYLDKLISRDAFWVSVTWPVSVKNRTCSPTQPSLEEGGNMVGNRSWWTWKCSQILFYLNLERNRWTQV